MAKDYLWWRDGVIYQIYPRSYADSNGDGIGDLAGITDRLDYLAELGIDAIWLSPVNPSPDVDFGYDVSDYKDIDPKFGTLADYDHLVGESHKRGIRVVLDLVLNHTSDQHPWFLESRKSKENHYRDYYLWRDPAPGGKLPNNWESVFGGRAWELDTRTGQYYYHMFVKEQPDLNWRNPAVREEMLDVFRFWAERGTDGFRLDVFNMFFKDDQFRSNPSHLGIRGFDRQEHIYDCDRPEMVDLVKDIRKVLDGYPERYAVGETFLGTTKAAFYSGDDLLHAAFNFDLLQGSFSIPRFSEAIQRWEKSTSGKTWPVQVLNNHDTKRTASRWVRGEKDDRLKLLAALLLTIRGTPFLYYGEEIGMRDIHVSRSMIQDPVGKRYWPFNVGRDGCRSPMQWDQGKNAGFSKSEPWLPIHPDFIERNVDAQKADPNSLFNFYRRLIHLRKKHEALRQGMYQPLTFEPRFILAYLRQTKEETILVAMNSARRPMRFFLGGNLARSSWELLLSSHREEAPDTSKGFIWLSSNEVVILKQK